MYNSYKLNRECGIRDCFNDRTLGAMFCSAHVKFGNVEIALEISGEFLSDCDLWRLPDGADAREENLTEELK